MAGYSVEGLTLGRDWRSRWPRGCSDKTVARQDRSDAGGGPCRRAGEVQPSGIRTNIYQGAILRVLMTGFLCWTGGKFASSIYVNGHSALYPVNGLAIVSLNYYRGPVEWFGKLVAYCVGQRLADPNLQLEVAVFLTAINALGTAIGSACMLHFLDLREKSTVSTTKFLKVTVLFTAVESIVSASLSAPVLHHYFNAPLWTTWVSWLWSEWSGTYSTIYAGSVVVAYAMELTWSKCQRMCQECLHWMWTWTDVLRVCVYLSTATLYVWLFEKHDLDILYGGPLLLLVFPAHAGVALMYPQLWSAILDVYLSLVAVAGTAGDTGPIAAILRKESIVVQLVFLHAVIMVSTLSSASAAVAVSVMRQAEQEEKRKGQEKLAYFSHISHEFRTPLSIIIGFAEQISGDKEISQRTRGDIDSVITAGNSLSQLVDDLLTIFRVDSGNTITVNKLPTVTDNVLMRLQSAVAKLAEEKSIIIVWRTQLPHALMLDSIRLSQVILNLVSNAIKYSEAFTTVRISACMDQRDIVFMIEDEGVGISEEDQAKLFQRFFRCSRTLTMAQGTGLGMTIVSQVAVAMGGNVSLQSELGVGSVFTVRFPAEIPSEDKHEWPMTDIVAGVKSCGKYRILVVEDSALNRRLLCRMLREKGHEVESRDNGEAGLHELSVNSYDILMLDLGLPKKSGEDVLREIRAMPPSCVYRDIPVIIISALVADEYRKQYEDLGCDAFAMKPFHSGRIEDTVHIVMQAKVKRLLPFESMA